MGCCETPVMLARAEAAANSARRERHEQKGRSLWSILDNAISAAARSILDDGSIYDDCSISIAETVETIDSIDSRAENESVKKRERESAEQQQPKPNIGTFNMVKKRSFTQRLKQHAKNKVEKKNKSSPSEEETEWKIINLADNCGCLCGT
jgi:hypothetical protein